MELILTRHTLTGWNLLKRMQGQTNTSLNAQGREDAALLAEKLRRLGIRSIASSDLLRAMQTTEVISKALGVSFLLEPRLRECCFGEIEGRTKQEAAEQYGLEVLQDLNDTSFKKYDFRRFGGESSSEVFARHIKALEMLVKLNMGSPTLIVGHGRGLCTLLAGLGLPPLLKQGEFVPVPLSEAELRAASLQITPTS